MHLTRKSRGIFFSLMLLLIPASVFGWSSQGESTFYGLAGTHQFMCKAAHAYFKHHPAAQFYDFPGIEAIISYSGVNTKQEGKGPDNPSKSNYSDHWYNALANQGSRGKTDVTTQDYYEKLVKVLRKLACTDDSDTAAREKLRQEAAEYAAYSGHYIQDMTCPFHLFGMPKSADRSRLGKEIVTGPFRKFDQVLWDFTVKQSNKDNGATSDWFDPNYYDGIIVAPSIFSSHVLYEGLVEINFYTRGVAVNKVKLWNTLRTDYAQKFWYNGMPVKEYVQLIAFDVLGRLEKRDPGLFVDSEKFQQEFQKAQGAVAEYLKSTGLGAIGIKDPANDEKLNSAAFQALKALAYPVPIPFREWAEGAQASYVLWRAAFCAAVIKKQNIMLLKVPNETGAYKIKVKVSNLEPEEAASDVKVTYKVKDNGQESQGGDAGIGSIPAVSLKGYVARLWEGEGKQEESDTDEPIAKRQDVESTDSDWIEIPGTFRIEGDYKKSTGVIRFAIKAKYAEVPDSGMSVVEYNIKDLATNAIRLLDLRKGPREGALNALSAISKDFQVTEKSVEAAPQSNLEHCVKEQIPEPGTWVSPSEKITLFEYDTYSQVTIKGRVKDLISNKGISGVLIQINVGGYSGQVSTQKNGTFELELALNSQIVRERPLAQVTINKEGYLLYRNSLNMFTEWEIELRPSEKPEFEVRIENPKIVLEQSGGSWYNHWYYEAVVKVKKVGVQFTKMDIREKNTSAGERLDDDISLHCKAGEEQRLRCKSGDAGDINNVVRETILRGMDDNGSPAQFSFTFRSDKKMVDKISQNQNMQADALIKQYLEAYEYQAGGFNLDAYEIMVPFDEAYKGPDHLLFVKALCELKKPKFMVNDVRKFNYDELNKIMILVQFYINKTAMTGDRRFEEKAAYIMQFLVPVNQFTSARCPAWNANTGERAKQLVPDFFSGHYELSTNSWDPT